MQPKVEINQGLMKLYIIFLRQVSIPFVQMIVFCHAELLICATVLQHRLSIAIVFLSFQIQDNEDDFRGTAQYGLMHVESSLLPHVFAANVSASIAR